MPAPTAPSVLPTALGVASVAAAGIAGLSWVLHHFAPTTAALPALFVALDLVPTAVAATLGGAPSPENLLPVASGAPQGVSVLVAAFNEEACILQTLASLQRQATPTFPVEVIVADDGSTDGTAERVEHLAATIPADGPLSLRLLRLPHSGKGGALNSALAAATYPVVVTVDADTELDAEALRRLAAPFVEPAVTAAAGAVVVRNAHGFLLRHQFVEYRKNTLLRRGWSALGALDQVPGAFGAYRAAELRRAGGFPTDSLTEDYEAIFRLRALAAGEGRKVQIPTIADARAYTEGPATLAGFVRQRTRWFAGFLSTLFRFRGLIFASNAGSFGLLKLPLKLVDAALPVVGLLALLQLLVGVAFGTHNPLPLLAFLAFRALTDAAIYLRAQRLAAGDPRPAPPLAVANALAEPFAFAWLKMLAVQRAYVWAARRTETWEPSRISPVEIGH